MTEATLTWSIWQSLLDAFAGCFTRRGFRRFAEWITAMALNVEEGSEKVPGAVDSTMPPPSCADRLALDLRTYSDEDAAARWRLAGQWLTGSLLRVAVHGR